MQLRHSLPTNTNPATGIAYGYIAANVLDPDVVNELQNGSEPYYEEAWKEFIEQKKREYDEDMAKKRQGCIEEGRDFVEDNYDAFDPEDYRDEFNNDWQPDEPVHEGEREGVKYRTSWLGGALNVWIFESPFITHLARAASPCVPGAAILDTLDGNVTGYDVPPDWRDNSAAA